MPSLEAHPSRSLASHTPILVIGAETELGRRLVAALRDVGQWVRLAVANPAAAAAAFDAVMDVGLSTARFDPADPDTVRRALDGVRRIVIASAAACVCDREPADLVAPLLAGPAIESVILVAPTTTRWCAATPARALAHALRRVGARLTVVRHAVLLQQFTEWHRDEIATHGTITWPAGRGRTSFLDADDVARAVARLAIAPAPAGPRVVLTGTATATYPAIAATLSETLGRPVAYRDVPVWRFLREARRRGAPWALVREQLAQALAVRLGEARRLAPDAMVLLGRAPVAASVFFRLVRHLWHHGP